MECSQLVVEFRFHLLRVQPCAIYYRPVYTKRFRNATILCRHWPRWYRKIVSRLYVRLIEVLNTWQYLLTHWLKILGWGEWWVCFCLYFFCVFFFFGLGCWALGWVEALSLWQVFTYNLSAKTLWCCQRYFLLAAVLPQT